MTTQDALWWTAEGALLLAVIAVAAEHRRARRRNLDRVGWVPWNFIQVAAALVALAAAALALKA